ncbi:copper chaperone [Kaistia soli DSM 19436]|uniref:Copper chaperone n=1 Tax=Kaistia soli DSM 19436 TaxID=1122133 RepID=A0A1M4ZPM1_9HYPH|nr:heavy-metal-associated domain-containing protein [Kaistia soli]SHF19875.1 copper chaperone [Kaistia soli DSM 19436]
MLIFTVPDMTCGHCASTIGKAARAAAPAAEVTVNLASKRVEVAGEADASVVAAAIRAAGYEPAAA